MTESDNLEFRDALGHFATGVTVITTLDSNGEPIGITANSFNSVSLDPPMVLWSIARQSGKRGIFEDTELFVVNVLAENQLELSTKFAKTGQQAFDVVGWEPGLSNLPLISGCAARFQCKKAYQYDGGDHIIIVGNVLGFEATGKEALVFHKGQYAVVNQHPATEENPAGEYADEALMALLMRATYEFLKPLGEHIAGSDLSGAEVRALTFLNDYDTCSLDQLASGTMVDATTANQAVDALCKKDAARAADGRSDSYCITDAGRRQLVPLLAIARAHEEKVLEGYTDEQVYRLKRALGRLAARSQG